VHRDFNYHHKTMLANTLIFITYLNRDWRPEYGGALELWDGKREQKIKEVAPVFGRSFLFRHSEQSFHGHPIPLTPPPVRSRRSLGSYYDVNDLAEYRQQSWRCSLFLDQLISNREQSSWHAMGVKGRLKYLARGLTPPFLWWAAKAAVLRKPRLEPVELKSNKEITRRSEKSPLCAGN
jgi:2OG-Fe(II) oxygenase superfamily